MNESEVAEFKAWASSRRRFKRASRTIAVSGSGLFVHSGAMTAEFKAAPWGTRIWVITVSVSLFLLGIIPAVLFSIPVLPTAMRWLLIGIDGSIVAISALFLIRGYVIQDGTLVVRRSFWETRLNLTGLRSVAADPDALRGAWKTLGNDGLFAIHGWFRGKRLGKFRAFVTDTAHSVVLDYGTEKVVVSPEDPEKFVITVKAVCF